jgi:hypothetical protein
MKDTIFLIINRSGVQAMRKSFVGTKRGEVCVKFNIEMPSNAFEPPVLEQRVYIDSWTKGIDMEDVDFKQNIITEEEAAIVRERRLAKMAEILKSQGYTVSKSEDSEEQE